MTYELIIRYDNYDFFVGMNVEARAGPDQK